MKITYQILILITFYFLDVVCIRAQSCDASTGNSPGETEYVLVWAEEFNEEGAVCDLNWHHQTQLPEGGNWYNGEEQHYTNRMRNSSVEGGILKITAIKESFTDQGHTKQYTSARLNSKYAFTYGRVDALAKLPSGAGTWPAIWMLGQNINEPGGYWYDTYGNTNWPQCGEIDIMEHWGNNPNVIHGSIHTTSSSGATINTGTTNIDNVSSTFHLYSIIWESNSIQFLVDDVLFYTYRPSEKTPSTWPFDEPQYLLLNIAMGGIGGAIDPAFTESTMEIDYIRVYQKEAEETGSGGITTAAPSPPVRSTQDVISVFSDTYTDIPNVNYNPNWNQSTQQSIEEISGNEVLKYSGFNYQGTELMANVDVSAMEYLHLDLWTADPTDVNVFLINPGPIETDYSLSIQNNEWNSYDIPLSEFTSVVDLTKVFEIKIDGGAGWQTIYLDNIYFYRDGNTVLHTPPNQDYVAFGSNGHLYLKNQGEVENGHIEVYSLSGAKVLDELFHSKREDWNFSYTGLFIVRLTNTAGEVLMNSKIWIQ